MASRSIQVGAFQAKTRLPELLREVERGKSFVILRRGRTVARLVPASDRPDSADFKRLLDKFFKQCRLILLVVQDTRFCR